MFQKIPYDSALDQIIYQSCGPIRLKISSFMLVLWTDNPFIIIHFVAVVVVSEINLFALLCIGVTDRREAYNIGYIRKKRTRPRNFNFSSPKLLLSLTYLRCFLKAVVLKLFCMFYPFNKDEYPIYPQYIKWCSFIKKTKETIYISYN